MSVDNETITLTKEELSDIVNSSVKEALKGVAKATKPVESPQEQALKQMAIDITMQSAHRDMAKARKYGARAVARAYSKSVDALADLF